MSKHSHSKTNSKQPLILLGIFVFLTLSVMALFMMSGSKDDGSDDVSSNNTSISDVVTESADGKQVIDITAKGGYSPRIITARADKETVLKVTTKNTFDCSSAFRIPTINYSKNLPSNGITEIPISADKAKGELVGTCSMGMYSFKINFI